MSAIGANVRMPELFTSTSGGPTSAAIRFVGSISDPSATDDLGHAALAIYFKEAAAGSDANSELTQTARWSWPLRNTAPFAALSDPTIKARLVGLGAEPMPMTPAAFGDFIVQQTEKWGNVIRAANIKAE